MFYICFDYARLCKKDLGQNHSLIDLSKKVGINGAVKEVLLHWLPLVLVLKKAVQMKYVNYLVNLFIMQKLLNSQQSHSKTASNT